MKSFLLAFVFVVAGCASTTPHSLSMYSDTMEIIEAAAESAPNGVGGLYTLKIVAAGNQGKFIYLNTEQDYRDQRAVTIALHPRIIPKLTAKFGVSPQEYFVDKTIVVKGQAKRIKIDFTSEGKPTGKYYYQTHIRLMDVSQIDVVDGDA